jgi:hypothetical protein
MNHRSVLAGIHMTHRRRAQCLAVVVAAGSLIPVVVAGQSSTVKARATKTAITRPWAPPLAPDGHPDLQGIWINNSATPLERPAELASRALLTDEEVTELKKRATRLFNDPDGDVIGGDIAFLTALANVDHVKTPNAPESRAYSVERDFDARTSLIVTPADGKIPFTPDGQRRQAAALKARQQPAPAPQDLPNELRCITFGIPRVGGSSAGFNRYYRIAQNPGHVVLLSEMIHDARIIPLDGRPHIPSTIRQWLGDSRGHWEGGTLVVETTNFSATSFFLGATENLHLLERFTPVAQDRIDYEITVSDLGTWTRPWTAIIQLKQSHDRMYEFACHEGNFDTMPDILSGARAQKNAPEEPARGRSE